MRRAIAIPLSVLSVLFCLSLWNSSVLDKHAARWCQQLQQTSDAVRREDWLAAELALRESYEDWCARRTYLCIVAVHDEVNGAETAYTQALALTAARDESGSLSELAGLQAQLQALAEMERLSIRNIL